MRSTKEQLNLLLLSKLNYTRRKKFFSLLLLVCGDISLNPGPTRYPCAVCEKGVRKGVFCSHCNSWAHQKCEGISNIEYRRLSQIPKEIFSYTCSKCTMYDELPFHYSTLETLESSVDLGGEDLSINELN